MPDGSLSQPFLDQSGRDVWQTPEWLVAVLCDHVHIHLDPFAGPTTCIGAVNYTDVADECCGMGTIGDVDALERAWLAPQRDAMSPVTAFINPPFSKKALALQKLYYEMDQGRIDRAVFLTPDSPCVQSWWQGTEPRGWPPEDCPDELSDWRGGCADRAAYVWFSQGRIAFYDPVNDEVGDSPSFGTALHLIGGPWPDGLLDALSDHGDVWAQV